MNQIQSSRFKDAPWFPKEETHVIVGGAGGIGSWLTLLLARAGFTPIVYDFDRIEVHNIGGQLFTKDHADKNTPKVEALQGVCQDFADTEIIANNEKYVRTTMSHEYVFSAFDNMKARRDMFDAWKDYVADWEKGEDKSTVPVFIDGRLLMEQLTIFCVTPDKIEDYEEHLFSDDEVQEAPCTLKQTSHSAAMIASHMVGFFTNHFANNEIGEDDRAVPFMWEYFIPINFLNEVNNPVKELKELVL